MTPGLACVVIGGLGAVGSLFVDLLADDGADVCVVDRSRPESAVRRGVRVLVADVEHPDPALTSELSESSVVILAVPESVAVNALPVIVEHLLPGGLIVDTLSVKTRIVAAERRLATAHHVVSLNPMFAPSLGVAGRSIAAVVVHDGSPVQDLLERLVAWGARPILMAADHHDQLAAATQVLTHAAILAVGMALAQLEVDVDELCAVGPPPHQTLLALLARIVSGTPETYWDVQAGNPYGRWARAALHAAVVKLDTAVDSGEAAPFHGITAALRELFGQHLGVYGERCAQAFRLEART